MSYSPVCVLTSSINFCCPLWVMTDRCSDEWEEIDENVSVAYRKKWNAIRRLFRHVRSGTIPCPNLSELGQKICQRQYFFIGELGKDSDRIFGCVWIHLFKNKLTFPSKRMPWQNGPGLDSDRMSVKGPLIVMFPNIGVTTN